MVRWWLFDDTSGAVRHQSAHSSFTHSFNPIVIITHRPPILPHFCIYLLHNPHPSKTSSPTYAATTTTAKFHALTTTFQFPHISFRPPSSCKRVPRSTNCSRCSTSPPQAEPMSSAAGQKAVRKFPPPCWTRDEALVLIEAYRERWHALHRAFLRTPDWDAVAEKVATSCPDVVPPKTSAQCRHKMEKLRQRHRAEKQRASGFHGERFYSTWFYYEAMEAMENGSNTEPGTQGLNPGPGIRVKPLATQNFATLTPRSTKHRMKPNPNFGPNVSNRYSSYPSNSSNQNNDHEDRSLVETPIKETLIPTAYRGREAKSHKKYSLGGGIRIKPPITPQEESGRPGLRPRKFSKVVHDDEDDDNGEMWIKVPRSTNSSRGKWQNEKNSIPNGKNFNRGRKNGGIADVVTSIKLLGEGFMKVEKMKMDMAREIEQMRMDAEMQRSRLMLESQKQIVDAFVNGLIGYRKLPTTVANT